LEEGNVVIKKVSLAVSLLLIGGLTPTFAAGASASPPQSSISAPPPEVTQAVAFDVSPAVRDLASGPAVAAAATSEVPEVRT